MTKTREFDCVGVKSLCKRKREKEKKRRETAGNASQNNNNNNTHKKEIAFPFFFNILADAHSNTHNSHISGTVFFFSHSSRAY